MTDTSLMNYALTSSSASANPGSTSNTNTNSMAAAAAFYQQQAAASAALASLDPTSSHHHQPLATAAAASALANVDTPRYPWMSITGKASSLFSHSLAHSCIPSCMYVVQEGAYFFRGHLEDATLGSSYCTALQCQNLLPGSGRVWRLRRQPLWWLAVFEDHRKEASCFLTNVSQVCVRV